MPSTRARYSKMIERKIRKVCFVKRAETFCGLKFSILEILKIFILHYVDMEHTFVL